MDTAPKGQGYLNKSEKRQDDAVQGVMGQTSDQPYLPESKSCH